MLAGSVARRFGTRTRFVKKLRLNTLVSCSNPFNEMLIFLSKIYVYDLNICYVDGILYHVLIGFTT